MTKKRKQFLKDVEHEIVSLREKATDAEKASLRFDRFDPIDPQQCIYGQIAGNCHTFRAKELMLLCCVRVMDIANDVYIPNVSSIDDERFRINGTDVQKTWPGIATRDKDSQRDYKHMSVLEAYIQLPNSPNEHILKFIKGEVDELVLIS